VIFGLLKQLLFSRSAPLAHQAIVPEYGNYYAFQTPAYTGTGPTGRYGVFQVVHVRKDWILIAVLDGVWNRVPSFWQAIRRPILKQKSTPSGKESWAFVNVPTKGKFSGGLGELYLLGNLGVRNRDLDHIRLDGTFCSLATAGLMVEIKWRRQHDPERLDDEIAERTAQERTQREQAEERLRTRLRGLTWDQLLAEAPFAGWTLPFAADARIIIHEACRELQALGPKPRRPQVRVVLKRCVEWFNDADREAGGVIETVEREEIHTILEEMAYVSRQKMLVDEIETWRTW
jgi:hypothetical protein